MKHTRPTSLGRLVPLLVLALCFATASTPALVASGPCDGTWASVNGPSNPSCSTYVVQGSGFWAVGGGANAVKLTYSIDGTTYQEEIRYGTSGSWSFSDDVDCADASGALRVDATAVVSSGGVQTVCLQHTDWDAELFLCLPQASLSCTDLGNDDFKCFGSLSGGDSPYSNFEWNEGGGWFSGSSPQILECPSGGGQLKFRGQDAAGCTSTIDSEICGDVEW